MHNRPKTLIILTPAFPANEEDSVWVPSKQLFVRKLKENFPSLKIIVLTFLYPQHTQSYSWRGIPVIPFNGMHARKFKRLLLWVRIWKKLSRLKKENNIIGLYSFWCGECALVGKYFARWHKLKHFCWISGLDATKENHLIKYIRPKPAELVAMSEFLVQEFKKNHGVTPKYIIPIGIDPLEFGEAPVQRDIDLLGTGSFNPFKQYDVFIQIVKKLTQTFPDIKAVICGDGTERENLQKLITGLQLGKNITLIGIKPHTEALQWMQRSKIFIHPSAYEGFGAVCLEALYAGAQVISFCDPMKINNNRWHIAKDPDNMYHIALQLLNNPHPEFTPVLLYSMDDTAKLVMELFETG